MRKLFKFCVLCLILAGFFSFGTVLADRSALNENLIRFHVVAASDSEEDQSVKLRVRDAVLDAVEGAMRRLPTADQAKEYLSARLNDLENLANKVLEQAGSRDRAKVTLEKEAFSTRQYDTFALPAGVYESLRITIGEGRGQNWWCVVFPSLCMSQTREDLSDTAAGAGFPGTLTDTLEQKKGYEVRFFLLDCLGWIENWIRG